MSRYHQGQYLITKPEKYVGDPNNVVFRSGWERILMKRCEVDPNILKWASEETIVPYFSKVHRKWRRYFVDFILLVRRDDGTTEKLLVEVKPNSKAHPPVKPKRMTKKAKGRLMTETIEYQVNQDKWNAAREYARRNGMRFVVMDEYALGIKKRPKAA